MFFKTTYALERIHVVANKNDYDLATGKYVFRTGEPGLDRKLNATVLADWQMRDLREAKTRFKTAGFTTYRDVEHLAIQVLQVAQLSTFARNWRFVIRFWLSMNARIFRLSN